MTEMGPTTKATGEAPPSRARVWVALLATPMLLACAFLPVAGYLVTARGLSGEALAKAIEPLAVFPASIGFAASFLLTRWLARKDGLTLSVLGWGRPTLADAAVGVTAATVLGLLNAVWLYPLVQRSQPNFDPTLPSVSLPAAIVTLVVAAVAEDTLYRGYALEVLSQRHGKVVSLLVTSTFYALVTPARGLPLVLWAGYFGIVLGVLRFWRKSLWPVTLVHCVVALGPKVAAQF